METGNEKYYILNEVNQELIDESNRVNQPLNKIGGKYDPASLIYSNLTYTTYEPDEIEGLEDPYEIRILNDKVDVNRQNYDDLKVLLPEGFRDVLSIDTSKKARICIG